MKRLGGLILAVLCAAACAYGYRVWLAAAEAAPLAAFIALDGASLPDELETVRLQLEADGYQTQILTNADDFLRITGASDGPRADVAVWKPAGTAPDRTLVQSLQQADIPLVLAGDVPDWLLSSGYDKLWCISSAEADAGELLGQQVAQAFREGLVFDKDEDHLLDRLTLSDGSDEALAMLDAAYTECEHYGVYSADCTPPAAEEEPVIEIPDGEEELPETDRPADESALPLSEQWAALDERPEVIFCIGADCAVQALQTAEQLGWLAGQVPVRLAAVVENEAEAQALAGGGNFCAVVYYDLDAEKQALYDVGVNLLEHRAAAYGTALRQKDGLPCFVLPYRVAEVTLAVPEEPEEEL